MSEFQKASEENPDVNSPAESSQKNTEMSRPDFPLRRCVSESHLVEMKKALENNKSFHENQEQLFDDTTRFRGVTRNECVDVVKVDMDPNPNYCDTSDVYEEEDYDGFYDDDDYFKDDESEST